jgi:steroid delta-isomerase-like uncharacterized protein
MKKIRACVLLLVALVIGCAPAGDVDSATADSEGVARQFIQAINDRDWESLESLVAEDLVRHSASTPGISVTNREEFLSFLRADLESVPDAIQEVDLMFGSGDMVAVRARYLGTQTGQLGPFPPSGKAIDLPFIGLLRIEDGQVAEIWAEWNNLEMLSQLGYFPPPGADDATEETGDPLGVGGAEEN